MRRLNLFFLLLLGALLASCTDLTQVNPNQQTTRSFWDREEDALKGINATYNILQNTGVYGRWLYFAYDMRSDLSLSHSPWTDLSNFSKFTFSSYDFDVNIGVWNSHYEGIYRTNQVITRVPSIDMNPDLRRRIVGEAQFIRALLYFNLVTLYGGNIPLVLEPLSATDRPPSSTAEKVWAQIEEDLKAAQSALPVTYNPDNYGRATKGAATALLGKVHLQQREWSEAAAAFKQVIQSPADYGLIADYAALFDAENEHHEEVVFAVQFTDDSQLSTGAEGCERPRMIGPFGLSFADGQPTQWFFEQFFKEKTTSGEIDPRLAATIFYNRPGGMDVYGKPFAERYGADSEALYWKKYTEYYKTAQTWNSEIDFIVIRFADVLLMYAEALNELGRTSEAYAPINRVRARVNLPPLQTGMSQAQMRKQIAHERIVELGGESGRFLYLKRHDLLSTDLASHDPEFQFFEKGKSERLPIPQSEINLNTKVKQNPGY